MVKISYEGFTGDRSILTRLEADFRDPAKWREIGSHLDDLPSRVSEVKLIATDDPDVGTWQGKIVGSVLEIQLNPTASLTNPGLTHFSPTSVFIHEIAHHKVSVERASAESANRYIADNPAAFQRLVDAIGPRRARDAIEYGFEEGAVQAIAEQYRLKFNSLPGEGLRVNLSTFDQALRSILTGPQVELSDGAFDGLSLPSPFALPSGNFQDDGVHPIAKGEHGNVLYYLNEDFDVVKLDEDSNYSEGLLGHYGIEERQDDGSIMGRTTFWATVKAAADGLGLDGQFGIQGTFANPDEGTHDNEGNPNGVRGDSDRDSSTDNSNNVTNYLADRDGDGVPNVIDFNDGVGWADQAKEEDEESAPIIFDLDGDGIQITELSNSSIYVDATGDGLENRTAWAGAGDAVLFYDPDNTGEITEMRQYVFTEWDPTAATDMEALASVFDLNGDGVLSGDELDQFRLMVTNADGSTTAMTLTDLGIVSIDLTADATNIELPDGSVITGQTTFTRDDGSTGTVADVTLIAEVDGHRLEQVETFDANGTRTEVTTGYDADGSIDFVNTTVVSADGAQIANSYDDNGDGVVDRLQTIETVTNPDGSTVKTVTNSLGAAAATAILLNETRTTTSADGNTVSIDRDSIGGGWYDQTEVRVTAADGSMTIVTSDRSPPDVGETYGDAIRTVTEDVSADGLTRTEAIDNDGDGVADLTMTHVIVVNPDGSRAETVTVLNQDGSVRSVVTETVSADGQTKTISSDVDGDGSVDTVQDTDIVTGPTGSTSTIVVTNGDGSTRNTVTYVQSDDALTKSSASDLDGDGVVDVTTVDQTVINADGSRVQTITSTNTDGSIRGMQEITLGSDQVSSETWVDLNQNGIFEATDLVRSVTVDGTTGDRTATSWDRNADGSVNAVSTSVTSADGLTRTTTTDLDGDGDIDATVADVTTVNGAGVATRTVTTTNQDGSLRSEVVSETSADGLATTTTVDTDGDGALDGTTNVSQTNNGDGTVTRTSSTYAGDGVTLLSESVSVESADRLVMTTTTDANGDGSIDREVVSTQNIDGSQTVVEISFHADGTVAGTQTTEVSADGLVVTTTTDADGDGVSETISDSTTTLDADGGRTQTNDVRNNDDSLRSQTITTVSDDGLTTTSQTDNDGDGAFERTSTVITTLNADGSASTLSQTQAEDGSLISQTLADTSDDGLVVTQSTDADGDGTYDLISTTTTTLEADGGTTTVNEVRDAAGVLRSGSTTTASDDGRNVTRSVDSNGDGNADQVSVTIEADDGTLTSTTSQLAADGTVQSSSETEVSANGLETTVREDRDGDGITDMVMTDVTTLNADGSTTRTTTDLGGDGTTAYSTSTTVTNADGRTSTRTNDYDNDGIADLTIVSHTDLAADGTQTQTTTRTSADGSTLGVLTVETSADGRTVTTNNDTDGNGNDDLRTVSVVADDGTRTSTTEYLSTGGVVESSYQVITSGDGLTTTRLTDRNGDGEIDLRTLETSAIAADGTVTRTVEHRGQHHVLEGREEYMVSDDGMSSTSSLDLDGDGLFDFITDVDTTYVANGDVIHHEETRDITSDILSDVTTTTSGDGLTTDVVTDYSGDGSVDRTTSIVRGADGGFTSLVQHYGAGYDLQRTETQTVSADGRTSVQTIDLDGDGFVDQRVESVIDLSGNTTTTYENVQINGAVTSTVTGFEAANGMHMSYSFDVDGNGTTDITRTTDVSYEADGDMVRTFTETYGATTVYEETTTTAADGLSSTGTFDIDGDGDIDGTTSSVTTLNADGSRATVTETHYADGELHSRVIETVSADGRTTTREMDYDGNGIADKVSETVIASDGSRVNTETSFNEAGIRGNTFTTTTSADGLTTTVMRQGNVQTTTRSVLDNGSYEWENGVAAGTTGHLSTSHEIDALGVETWSLTYAETVKITLGTANTAATYQYRVFDTAVRLDPAAKAQLFEEAASIYDTILDRGMDSGEREQLVRWIADGQLDKVALIEHLTGVNSGAVGFGTSGSEYTTRYGAMTDAEFISQTYMNTFGRSPSMVELAEHLNTLDAGVATRVEIALELADSVEHGVVGNGHMLTNNFDVIMNPAVFERSLDEAYVTSVITNLVDVVYDRAPTAQELTHLSELLLEGDELPDDIATILLGLDGEIESVPSNSLNGLAGTELVEQAFMNALGRAPSQAELDLWTGNLTAGTITIAQFVASLAQSTEHLEAGNGHVATGVPSVNNIVGTSTPSTGNGGYFGGGETLNGGAGIDYFKGGTGDDTFKGGDGNDIYEWAKGDGNDTIDDTSTSLVETDTLILTDVNPDDVTLTRDDGSLDLTITIISTGEVITGRYNYSNDYPGRGIESIEFADGTIWDLADIRAATTVSGNSGNNTVDGKYYDDNLFGLEGNDTLNGEAGDDLLVGGTGVDTLKGGSGSDTYVWSPGDGADKINETVAESGTAWTDIDTLVLNGVTSADVTLTRPLGSTESRNDLHVNISLDGVETTVGVWDQFTGTGAGVEQIVFADGVIWDREDINAHATLEDEGTGGDTVNGNEHSHDNIYGHDGNDTLNGLSGDDWLYGGLGDDTLKGGTGGDTYVWSVGDGNDIVNEEHNPDATQLDHLLLTDVNSTDVIMERENSTDGELRNDLYIVINGTETIEVFDQFKTNGEGLEQITFADGVIWTREDILNRTRLEGTNDDDFYDGPEALASYYGHEMQLVGSAVRDNIYGLAGDDTIDAGGGDDWLYGGLDDDTLWGDAGNDTYVYSEGDGNDEIRDTGATDAETDTLVLTDINADEATLAKSADDMDLIVTITATGETITVTDRFDAGTHGTGDGIEFITFADGVIVEVLGGALAETITTGTEAANTLNGWGLEDTIYGLGGNDTIDGNGGDDTLIGGAGDDTLHGDIGNDTYQWSAGDGNDLLDDNGISNNEIDRLVLTDIASDGVSLERPDGSPHLEITILETGEVITVHDQYNNLLDGKGIEEISFSDGVVWDLNDIQANTVTIDDNIQNVTGSDHADNMFGLEGDDTLDGFAGDDMLVGGQGDDTLNGGDGNDTYVWSDGDGSDIIVDSGFGDGHTDTLVLNDLLAGDVQLERLSGSNDLHVVIDTGQQNNASTAGSFLYEYYDGNPGSVLNIASTGADGAGVTQSTKPGDMKSGHSGNYDNFGLRLASVIEVTTAGTYEFTTGSDDGSMLWIDGVMVVDNDGVHGYEEQSGTVFLTPGQHTIEVRYFEQTSASTLNVFVDGPDTGDVRTEIIGSGMLGNAADAAHLLDQTNFLDIDQRYDVITVEGQFSGDDGNGIESVVFGDGTVLTANDIAANTATTGDAKQNTFDGSVEADRIFGLGGNDIINGDAGDDQLDGGEGDDIIDGDDGNDSLFGGDGNDELIGGAGADLLYGGAGNDLLRGDGDADYFDGGDGVDTVDFSYSNDDNTVNLATGQVDWPATGDIETIVNVENVIGSSGDNIIIGDSADNHLDGANGEDILNGGAGNDVLEGGNGRDSFIFATGDGADIIADFDVAEDDITINGVMVFPPSLGSGVTAIQQGNDVLISYGAGDTITLSDVDLADWTTASTATIDGTNSANTIDRDFVDGQGNMVHDGGQTILGKDGEDLIHAGAGDDLIYGGSHYDTIYAGAGNDQVWGDNGRDTIWLEAGDDIFHDNTQSNSNAHDTVYGGDGNDTFNGGGGNDIFSGDAGDDTLSGGIGNDTLTGGTDADTFVFSIGDGSDVITDFENSIDMLDFTSTGLTFGDLTITTEASGSTIVTYGSGDQIELLNTSGQIDQSDFIFV